MQLSVDTTPNVRVIDGIMASLSIPVLFKPCSLENSEEVYVDGGLINNFPINVFDPSTTLGIRLCWTSSVDKLCYNSLDQYLARVAYCVLSQAEELQNLQVRNKQVNVINIDVNISTIAFYISDADKQHIINRGALFIYKAYFPYVVLLFLQHYLFHVVGFQDGCSR